MSAIEQNLIELESGTLGVRTAGNGPDLLLLHSLGLSGWMWEQAIEGLAASYRVIAPDFPGYGRSPQPDSAWLIEDYAGIVAELGRELGVASWHVAGNSFGALVAAKVAAAATPQALSLSLLGLPIWPDSAGRFEWLKQRTAPLNPDGSAPPATQETAAALIADADDTVIARMNEDRAVTGPWYQQTMWALATFDPTPVLASLKLPILVAYGEGDPFKAGEPVATEAVSDAKTATIGGGGHFAPLDAPQQTVAAMTDYLNQVDG